MPPPFDYSTRLLVVADSNFYALINDAKVAYEEVTVMHGEVLEAVGLASSAAAASELFATLAEGFYNLMQTVRQTVAGEVLVEFIGGKVRTSAKGVTVTRYYVEHTGVLVLLTDIAGVAHPSLTTEYGFAFDDAAAPYRLEVSGEPHGRIRLAFFDGNDAPGFPTNGGPFLIRVLGGYTTTQTNLVSSGVQLGRVQYTMHYDADSSPVVAGAAGRRYNLAQAAAYPLELTGAVTQETSAYRFTGAGALTVINSGSAYQPISRGLSFHFKYRTTQSGVTVGLAGAFSSVSTLLQLWVQSTGAFRFRAAISGVAFEVITNTGVWDPDDQWHTVDVVYDGNTTVRIYHDGGLLPNTTQVIATAANRNWTLLGSAPFRFGASVGGGGQYVGRMDDLGVSVGHMWTDRELWHLSGRTLTDVIVMNRHMTGPVTDDDFTEAEAVLGQHMADIAPIYGGPYYPRPYYFPELGMDYEYIWFFSTDHSLGQGGIYACLSNDLDLQDRTDAVLVWGPNQPGYPVYVNEKQFETPWAVWNEDDPDLCPLYIYYQSYQFGDGSQDTRLIKCSGVDSQTGELQGVIDVGKVLDASPVSIHYGYFLPEKLGHSSWIGWSLNQRYRASQGYPHIARWISTDGIAWTLDVENYNNTSPVPGRNRRVDIGGFQQITLNGKRGVISYTAPFASAGAVSANHCLCIAYFDETNVHEPLTGEVQYLDCPPQDPETGYASGIRGVLHYVDFAGNIHLYPTYQGNVYHIIGRIRVADGQVVPLPS